MNRALMSFAAAAAVSAFTLVASPANATTFVFAAGMGGQFETAKNNSPAVGYTQFVYDDGSLTLTVDISYSGLTAPATDAHVHCCAPLGTNASVAIGYTGAGGFATGATSGTYHHVFTLTDQTIYGGTFLTNNGGTADSARAAFITGLFANLAYSNIHTSNFPGGEIRGQLTVPEPGTIAVFGISLVGLAFARRRAKKRS